MLKIFASVALLLLVILLGNELYFFWSKNRAAQARYGELRIKFDKARADYRNLEADFNYYLNPANLEKELRARFNYRHAGEKLIIIVPKTNAPTPSTSNQ